MKARWCQLVYTVLIYALSLTTTEAQTINWNKAEFPSYMFVVKLAGMSNGTLFAGLDGAGIYRSLDAGSTWIRVLEGALGPRSFARNPSGRIFAACTDGMYVSDNGGATWLLSCGNAFESVAAGANGILFRGTQWYGIDRSMDGGYSWNQCNADLRYVSDIEVLANGTVLAACDQGVYKSTDNGVTWVSTNVGAGTVFSSVASSSGGDIYAAGNAGVYRSTNNGSTWIEVNSGLVNDDVYDLIATPAGFLFAATAGGVFRSSNNGGTWSRSGAFAEAYSVAVLTGGNQVFVGSKLIQRSSDNGLSWVRCDGSIPALRNVMEFSKGIDGTYYAGGMPGVMTSTDHGHTWVDCSFGGQVTSFVCDKVGNAFAGTLMGGVFRSSDRGVTWSQMKNGFPQRDVYVYSLSVSSDGSILAGTDYGEVYRSSNNGQQWTKIKTGSSGTYVEEILVDTQGRIFVGLLGGGGLQRSTDGGTTWMRIDVDFYNTDIVALTATPSGDIYAGSRCDNGVGGIYHSTDHGGSWSPVIFGLPTSNIYDLAAMADGSLLAAVRGEGIYSSYDLGQNWSRASTGLTTKQVSCLFIDDDMLLCGSANDGVFWSLQPPMPSISISAPISGNLWPIGSTRTIGWSASNVSTVRIDYSTDNGSSWVSPSIVSSAAASQGSYNWTVPNKPSSKCRIKITDLNSGRSAISALFAIYRIDISFNDPFENTDDFYPNTPIPEDKVAVRLSLMPQPSDLPSTLKNVKVSMSFDGQPMTLFLNTSKSQLDADGDPDHLIDSIPSALRVNGIPRKYVHFVATSKSQANPINLLNKNLVAQVVAVDGNSVNFSASDVVSLYFAKHPSENRSFWMLQDAFKFPNYTGLTLGELVTRLAPYGLLPVNALYAWFQTWGGRCFGMSKACGLYFLEPALKPRTGYPYDWESNDAVVQTAVTDLHLTELFDESHWTSNFDALEAFATMKARLSDGKPTILAVKSLESGHAVLATKLTTFQSMSAAFVGVYDSKKPSEAVTAIFELSGEGSFQYYPYRYAHATAPENNVTITSVSVSRLMALLGILQSTSISAACPVALLVFDEHGNKTGQVKGGTLVNEIPGANVSRFPTGEADGDSLTLVQVPQSGHYRAEIAGTSTGKMRLEFMKPAEGLRTTDLYVVDSISVAPITTFFFDDTHPESLAIDRNGDGNADSVVMLRTSVIAGTPGLKDQLPKVTCLEQNFPNPFNPTTTIRYGLPNRSPVFLGVYNTLGQQVATLVNTEQEAGYHEVRLDVGSLSSGVYIYRMQAGAYTEAKKLLLLR
jgi:ligand-binding sensor domain-containing protein